MRKELRMESETNLSKTWLHIYTQQVYQEDYQIPMLRYNHLPGILPIEGCEVEGMGRYSYDVTGMTTLKAECEKKLLKKEVLEHIVQDLLKSIDLLQQYMLNPDCLLLQPQCIYLRGEQTYFCYVPGAEAAMNAAFHELSEYFVKMLDYEDTESVYLAHKLHKETLREQYDLPGLMKEYKQQEGARRAEAKASQEERTKQTTQTKQTEAEQTGNLFVLTDESEVDEEKENYRKQFHCQKKYEVSASADSIHEESGWRPAWRKALRHLPGKGWGQWNDLIMETDGQERKSTL